MTKEFWVSRSLVNTSDFLKYLLFEILLTIFGERGTPKWCSGVRDQYYQYSTIKTSGSLPGLKDMVMLRPEV